MLVVGFPLHQMPTGLSLATYFLGQGDLCEAEVERETLHPASASYILLITRDCVRSIVHTQ